MPRTARIVILDYPHHIIQRGHHRQTVFASDDDLCYYLDNLAEWKEFYTYTRSLILIPFIWIWAKRKVNGSRAIANF
ncbi:MAG: hypothetical protein QM483_12075 [Desulfuromusa sp.]